MTFRMEIISTRSSGSTIGKEDSDVIVYYQEIIGWLLGLLFVYMYIYI